MSIKIQHLEDYEHQFLNILVKGIKARAEEKQQSKQFYETTDCNEEKRKGVAV